MWIAAELTRMPLVPKTSPTTISNSHVEGRPDDREIISHSFTPPRRGPIRRRPRATRCRIDSVTQTPMAT